MSTTKEIRDYIPIPCSVKDDEFKGGTFECALCNFLCSDRIIFHNHFQEQHRSNFLPCITCGKLYSSARCLIRHIDGFHKNSLFVYRCGKEGCDFKSTVYKTFLFHIIKCDQTEFICYYCKTVFQSPENLIAHLESRKLKFGHTVKKNSVSSVKQLPVTSRATKSVKFDKAPVNKTTPTLKNVKKDISNNKTKTASVLNVKHLPVTSLATNSVKFHKTPTFSEPVASPSDNLPKIVHVQSQKNITHNNVLLVPLKMPLVKKSGLGANLGVPSSTSVVSLSSGRSLCVSKVVTAPFTFRPKNNGTQSIRVFKKICVPAIISNGNHKIADSSAKLVGPRITGKPFSLRSVKPLMSNIVTITKPLIESVVSTQNKTLSGSSHDTFSSSMGAGISNQTNKAKDNTISLPIDVFRPIADLLNCKIIKNGSTTQNKNNASSEMADFVPSVSSSLPISIKRETLLEDNNSSSNSSICSSSPENDVDNAITSAPSTPPMISYSSNVEEKNSIITTTASLNEHNKSIVSQLTVLSTSKNIETASSSLPSALHTFPHVTNDTEHNSNSIDNVHNNFTVKKEISDEPTISPSITKLHPSLPTTKLEATCSTNLITGSVAISGTNETGLEYSLCTPLTPLPTLKENANDSNNSASILSVPLSPVSAISEAVSGKEISSPILISNTNLVVTELTENENNGIALNSMCCTEVPIIQKTKDGIYSSASTLNIPDVCHLKIKANLGSLPCEKYVCDVEKKQDSDSEDVSSFKYNDETINMSYDDSSDCSDLTTPLVIDFDEPTCNTSSNKHDRPFLNSSSMTVRQILKKFRKKKPLKKDTFLKSSSRKGKKSARKKSVKRRQMSNKKVEVDSEVSNQPQAVSSSAPESKLKSMSGYCAISPHSENKCQNSKLLPVPDSDLVELKQDKSNSKMPCHQNVLKNVCNPKEPLLPNENMQIFALKLPNQKLVSLLPPKNKNLISSTNPTIVKITNLNIEKSNQAHSSTLPPNITDLANVSLTESNSIQTPISDFSGLCNITKTSSTPINTVEVTAVGSYATDICKKSEKIIIGKHDVDSALIPSLSPLPGKIVFTEKTSVDDNLSTSNSTEKFSVNICAASASTDFANMNHATEVNLSVNDTTECLTTLDVVDKNHLTENLSAKDGVTISNIAAKNLTVNVSINRSIDCATTSDILVVNKNHLTESVSVCDTAVNISTSDILKFKNTTIQKSVSDEKRTGINQTSVSVNILNKEKIATAIVPSLSVLPDRMSASVYDNTSNASNLKNFLFDDGSMQQEVSSVMQTEYIQSAISDVCLTRGRSIANAYATSITHVANKMQTSKNKVNWSHYLAYLKSKKTHSVLEKLLQPSSLSDFFKCTHQDCNFTSNSLAEFSNHCKEHSGELVECVYCLKGYSNGAELIKHSVHSHRRRLFQCSLCFYRACSQTHVDAHQQEFHPNVQGHVITGMPIQTEFAKQPDEIVLYTTVKKVTCCFKDCTFSTISITDIVFHVSKHPEIHAEYSCIECQTVCSSVIDWLIHHRLHGVHLLHCMFCTFGCNERLQMMSHLTTFHADNPLMTFVRTSKHLFPLLECYLNARKNGKFKNIQDCASPSTCYCYLLSCPEFEGDNNRIPDLLENIKIVKTHFKLMECLYCTHKTSAVARMEKHLKAVHCAQSQLNYYHCESYFLSSSEVKDLFGFKSQVKVNNAPSKIISRARIGKDIYRDAIKQYFTAGKAHVSTLNSVACLHVSLPIVSQNKLYGTSDILAKHLLRRISPKLVRTIHFQCEYCSRKDRCLLNLRLHWKCAHVQSGKRFRYCIMRKFKKSVFSQHIKKVELILKSKCSTEKSAPIDLNRISNGHASEIDSYKDRVMCFECNSTTADCKVHEKDNIFTHSKASNVLLNSVKNINLDCLKSSSENEAIHFISRKKKLEHAYENIGETKLKIKKIEEHKLKSNGTCTKTSDISLTTQAGYGPAHRDTTCHAKRQTCSLQSHEKLNSVKSPSDNCNAYGNQTAQACAMPKSSFDEYSSNPSYCDEKNPNFIDLDKIKITIRLENSLYPVKIPVSYVKHVMNFNPVISVVDVKKDIVSSVKKYYKEKNSL